MKMKLLIIFMISITLLTGCTNSDKPIETTPTPTEEVVVTPTPTPTENVVTPTPDPTPLPQEVTGINHDQVMSGDFSSIAGEYVDSEGKVIFLNDDGLKDGETAMSDVIYIHGMYQRSLWWGDSDTGGYAITIYPIGKEIDGVPTDTTKIRIAYGNGDPISDEGIYTKK